MWSSSLTISLGLLGIRGEHCSFIPLSTKHSTSLRTTPPHRCWSAHSSTYTSNFVDLTYTLPFCTALPFHNAVGLRLGNADDSTCRRACLRGINLLSASTLLIFSFTVSSLGPRFLVSDSPRLSDWSFWKRRAPPNPPGHRQIPVLSMYIGVFPNSNMYKLYGVGMNSLKSES